MTRPIWNLDLCTNCDKCRAICQFDAITKDHELILENCVGCESCSYVCESGALKSPEDESEKLQKRLAEVAHTVIRNLHYSNCIFVNFMIDITPFCDCAEFTPEYISQDIGVLASNDIVAIDLATIELIGNQKFQGDPTVQVREAHRRGLGELEYEIVKV